MVKHVMIAVTLLTLRTVGSLEVQRGGLNVLHVA